MSIQSAFFAKAPSPKCTQYVDAEFNSLTMVPFVWMLTCGLQCFSIVTSLLPFQLTPSNDSSLRFPVIQMDNDENIEEVIVETAGLFMDG